MAFCHCWAVPGMYERLLSIMQGLQVGMLRSLFNYLNNRWLFAIHYFSLQVFMMREILQLRKVWSVIITKNNPVSLILKIVALHINSLQVPNGKFHLLEVVAQGSSNMAQLLLYFNPKSHIVLIVICPLDEIDRILHPAFFI